MDKMLLLPQPTPELKQGRGCEHSGGEAGLTQARGPDRTFTLLTRSPGILLSCTISNVMGSLYPVHAQKALEGLARREM